MAALGQEDLTDVLNKVLLIFTNKVDFKFFLESSDGFYLLKGFWQSVPGVGTGIGYSLLAYCEYLE